MCSTSSGSETCIISAMRCSASVDCWNCSHGAFAGDGFDAAHAGRNAAFVNDLADADIAGARDMRAAAKLFAEIGDRNDAHSVAVFFAEQRHGAGGDGYIERHDVGVDRDVLEDLMIHEPLDFLDFGAVHGGVVREIKTQPVGLDDAAGLFDMGPSTLRSAACSRCVAVWLRMVAWRTGSFDAAHSSSPR